MILDARTDFQRRRLMNLTSEQGAALQQRLLTNAARVMAAVADLRAAMLDARQVLPVEQHQQWSRNVVALADETGRLVLTAADETPTEASAPLYVGQYL